MAVKANVTLSGLEWALRFRLNDIIHKNGQKRAGWWVWRGYLAQKQPKTCEMLMNRRIWALQKTYTLKQ